MIGVIYARYSSDSQREESIEGQLRECYAFAEKQGISILDTYIDRALSAKTDNRPAFQQMIKDSEKQKFNVVIVWKLDRFARNRYDSATYKSKLKKNAVKVISATETISQNAEGILLESMLEGMAEYYSAELAEKVGRGMTENALKCKFNGGTVPIGYIINKEQFFEVDPVKAPYVVDAFQAYADGKTIKEIVEMLNAKGVTTSHGTKITINIVTYMLKNRRYIGEYKFRDIVNPDGIPRIVPQALFDKVQRERAKNKRATARHKAEDDYLLTTKLFCGKCGVYMTGESGTARNGTVHRYYKCNNAKYKHTCDKKTVKKEWIEDIVVKHTHEMMIDDNVIEDIASIVFRNAKKENPAIQLLKQRLSETENALNNLLRAIEEGIITPTTKQRMIELEQTRDEIKLKLIKEEMKKPTITKEGLVLWLKHIQSMSLETKEHKQRLIDIFVNAVYLYDDKLVITFNYKEASKTVTLKEVNGSIIECSGAPEKNSCSFEQEFFQLYSPYGELYRASLSYICFASDIRFASFGGEYNITETARFQYHFHEVKISLCAKHRISLSQLSVGYVIYTSIYSNYCLCYNLGSKGGYQMSIKIGDNIAYYRKQKGLTQEELGVLLNISGQAVSKWENGGVPDISLLPEIAKIFDVSIDSLFGCKKKISEISKEEILNKLFKYSSYNYFHRKETFDSFQFLFECIWSIQSAYLGNEELFDYNEILEKYKLNPQITSQIITDEGTTYLSLVKGFPLFCAVEDSPEISKKLLNEDGFCEFFSLLAKDYGMKAVIFTQKISDRNQYTGKTISEKIGVTENEFAEVCPLLVKYGLLREETLLIDDNKVTIYSKNDNPELRPILMMVYQFIHARQCYYNFMSYRTEAYLKEVSD